MRLCSKTVQFTFLLLIAPLLLFILHFLPCPQNIRQPQLKVERVLRLRQAAFGNCSFTFCFHFYFTVFGPSLFLFACLFLCFTLPFTIRYMSVPLAVSVCVCVSTACCACRCAAFFEDETFCRIEFDLKGKTSRREKIYKGDLLFPSSQQQAKVKVVLCCHASFHLLPVPLTFPCSLSCCFLCM